MKKYYIALSVFLLIFYTLPVLAANTGPKAFFPETEYKFGIVAEGKKIIYDFIVQNKGNDLLNIEKVLTD